MTGKPGYQQSSLTYGEIDPLLHYRSLKYRANGAALCANIDPAPQGGFRLAPGSVLVGHTRHDAIRLHRFVSADGRSFHIVIGPGWAEAWNTHGKQGEIVHPFTAEQVMEMGITQKDDALLMFHPDTHPKRMKFFHDTGAWGIDDLPFENIPRHDYGGHYADGTPYSGDDAGTASVWELEFFNLGSNGVAIGDTVFALTISGQKSASIKCAVDGSNGFDEAATATNISDAMAAMSTIAPGYVVAAHASKQNVIVITFSGADNLGAKWSVAGEILNNSSAAIRSYETVQGRQPGEPIMSDARGWPACGTFYQQRGIFAGLKSRPATWIASVTGDYFNLDTSIDAADGAFVVPMDTEGGEAIVNVRAARNLTIFTTNAEYWISSRALEKTKPPNHVQASRNGSRPGVPLAENEGALVYAHKSGDVISEFRYTDVDGNYLSQELTLYATHLIDDVISLAQSKAQGTRDGNHMAIVLRSGKMRLATLLRDQEVTAFSRWETDGDVLSVSTDGDNVMMILVRRQTSDATFVNLERLDPDVFLQCAQKITQAESHDVTGIDPGLEGKSIWAIANDDIFGPLMVTGGRVSLPVAVSETMIGLWARPRMVSVPMARDIGPAIVKQAPASVKAVKIYVLDTSSIAVGANGGTIKAADMMRYGEAENTGELKQAVTAWLTWDGFTGMRDNLQIEISQDRPGAMTVAAWVIEAAL